MGGITEALGAARGEIERAEAQEVVLLWALREKAEQHCHDELSVLAKLAVTQGMCFRVHHYFSITEGRRLDAKCLLHFFPWTRGEAEEQRCLAVGTKEMKTKA